ncbi:MAG: sialate O-acetylesterase [Kiritimatiellia bacterium]
MVRHFVFTVFLSLTATLYAKVKLPSVFSSGMVLQQGQNIPVWGQADPGEAVTVTFAGQSSKATADKNGKWTLELKPLKASAKPAVFTVKGYDTVTFRDVLVGEVWFCSGQSNMEWRMSNIENAEKEIPEADNPLIRHFKVGRKSSPVPLDDIVSENHSQWIKTTPETIPGISAVAYMFGRRLHQELKVPVGLINSSWGGTRIEPWIPSSGFKGIEALDDIRKHVETADPKNAILWNGMVAGLVPYAVKGAIWYQGESNRRDGMLYIEKTRALVNGWRKEWGIPDLPYYLVQLAPYKYGGNEPYILPEMWEAQAAIPDAIKNTGYTVINDIGNLTDIHPRNKQDVGLRLANQALNRTYGRKNIEWSGPVYKSFKIEKNRIRLSFEYNRELRTRNGKAPDWFEICGPDGRYEKADAVIDGETVLISSPKIEHPAGFRYAWHQLAEPNLVNHLGLPTGAFRGGIKEEQ